MDAAARLRIGISACFMHPDPARQTLGDYARLGRRGVAGRAWRAARPLAERKACIPRFRAGVVRDLEALAITLTRETGKPIRMSRNELNGLLPRIDFFLKEVDDAIATETVFDENGLRERIEHAPLGVVGNISARNYPWFVGCNVIRGYGDSGVGLTLSKYGIQAFTRPRAWHLRAQC